MTTLTPEVQASVDAVREDVAKLHGELVRYGLVVWTGGNVSGRVPGADLFVIKPSGVSYDDLTAENMILCDLDGTVVPGTPANPPQPDPLPVYGEDLVTLVGHQVPGQGFVPLPGS